MVADQMEVRFAKTIIGHPLFLPRIDGSGAVRAFLVRPGGYLELKFLRLIPGQGIKRPRFIYEIFVYFLLICFGVAMCECINVGTRLCVYVCVYLLMRIRVHLCGCIIYECVYMQHPAHCLDFHIFLYTCVFFINRFSEMVAALSLIHVSWNIINNSCEECYFLSFYRSSREDLS